VLHRGSNRSLSRATDGRIHVMRRGIISSCQSAATTSEIVKCCWSTFYRAMHLSAYARSWDRMSSVCPSVRPSVTLVICDHIGWKSRKQIARTISPTPSLLVAERRSIYSQGNMEKFGGDLRWGREKVACWRTKSGNISETRKDRGKVTMDGL